MDVQQCLNDERLGPAVEGCRGNFDFTDKFEKIFLSLTPAAMFVALALARIAQLSRRKQQVGGILFQWLKFAAIAMYAVLNLCDLVIAVTNPQGSNAGLELASQALLFAAAVAMLPLSYLEHGKALRPSIILGIYVSLTLLLDTALARTRWLSANSSAQHYLATVFTSTTVLKAVILVLEATPKTKWIFWNAEEHSPEESSSIFSLGVYFWLNRLFFSGYRAILGLDDLYPLDAEMKASNVYAKLVKDSNTQNCVTDKRFGLLRDLCKAFAGPILLPAAPRVALIAFKFCQPLFINAILDYLGQPEESRRPNVGYGLIGACALIYMGIALSTAFYDYYNQRVVWMVRGCLVTAIYHHTIEAKLTDEDNSAAVTLMSTDVDRIVKGGPFVHEVWANLVEIAVGCWLLHSKLGLAFITPFLVIAVSGAMLCCLLRLFGKYQRMWMSEIERRVGLTANAIAHMKLYKISGIADTVSTLIQGLRVKEIKIGNQFRWLMIISAVLGLAPISLSPVITFAVTSRSLDVNTLFTSVSYIILVTSPLTMMFQYVPNLLSALACIGRIQAFIATEPRQDFRASTGIENGQHNCEDDDATTHEKLEPMAPDSEEIAFSVTDGKFGWGGETMTLTDINIRIPLNSLSMIVGPVASGKSTLCKALLGETTTHGGTIRTHGSFANIAFCEQTPFLYNATLKENIIGPYPFVESKYKEVIAATLLVTDINNLRQGHDTKIGSNGIMLSGGQKQRVSVARALYSESSVMIFDDILSGLDNDTGTALFRNVFGPSGLSKRRNVTTILCTHSVGHLPAADHIIALGPNGAIVEQGSFDDLLARNGYISSLGIEKGQGHNAHEKDVVRDSAFISESSPPDAESAIQKSRQRGDWSVYKHYFGTVKPWSLAILLLVGMTYGFTKNFATTWLKFWAEDSLGRPLAFYLGIYALLNVTQLLAFACDGITTMISMLTNSGTAMHKRAIDTVTSAPLRFFTDTDSGVVTNLFSQDMTLMDQDLPIAFTNVTLDMSDIIGMCFVIAAASPYLAIGYPFLFGSLYFLQSFYLRTSRQMRFLDLEAKSPLYSHFIDSIKGVATIRAFGWEKYEIARNTLLLDTSQRPAYLLGVMQKWLMATLQLMVMVLAVILVSLATQLHTNAGLTGASLVTLLSFGQSVSELIKWYTSLETSLGAISRLRDFSENVKPEGSPNEDISPGPEWPRHGRVDIHGVSASYAATQNVDLSASSSETERLVLRNISLTITPGQKVALCGRTGSGKSTMILLLLRLLDPLGENCANMIIDGVATNKIDRSKLRQRIIAIPQDAVFLPEGSSIKDNIDPFSQATDDECLNTLQAVTLGGFVEARGGLNCGMREDDLSAGQKQLFSLGRAVLRKRVKDRLVSGSEKNGGILLLDEVSSNVDVATDRDMQEIIKTEFEQYTVIMVSHRLEMVMDYFDKVVVLDAGSIVESGSPRSLVDTPGSKFGNLWAMGNHKA